MIAPTVRISYTVPNCRLRRWDVEDAVPYSTNSIRRAVSMAVGASLARQLKNAVFRIFRRKITVCFALRRRILRCKIRGRPRVAPTVWMCRTAACGGWDVEGAVPYSTNSMRRAEASDWSGGFSSPYGKHNPAGTSLAPGTAGRLVGRFQLALRLAKTTSHEFAPGPTRKILFAIWMVLRYTLLIV